MPKQTFFNLSDEKRENILSVAIREFADRGYEQASVSRIALNSGIAKGSFYQYFEGKDDLYEYICEKYISEKKVGLFTENEYPPGNMPDFLRNVFKLQVKNFIANTDIMKIALDFNRNSTGLLQQGLSGGSGGLHKNHYIEYIRREKGNGRLDPEADETLLNIILLGIEEYTVKLLAIGNKDYDSITEAQVDMIIGKLDYILTNGVYSKRGEDVPNERKA